MELAYDGAGFAGFAPNVGVVTVGGVLGDALGKILRHPVDLTCAGRTDKGVHARGQVVDFLTRADVDLDRMVRSANALCGPRIVVTGAAIVDRSFSSRFDATARRYRYTILRRPLPDPFLASTSWHVTAPARPRPVAPGL